VRLRFFTNNPKSNPIDDFQERVWSRITDITTAQPPGELLGEMDRERFVSSLRYIFDLRHGQNAARVAAAYLGYRLVHPRPEVTPALVEMAAALEIANTSITYIEDKLIDEDRENQRGKEWTHIRYGLPLTTVINSFVHFLSRHTLHNALTLANTLHDPIASDRWLRVEFEKIFRDANYGQFLDVYYGSPSLQTSIDGSFSDVEDPCQEVLSDHINDLRTGQFVRRSAEFGSIFAGLDPNSEQLRRLRTAMRLVGICVQDLNDLQDFIPAEGFPGSCGKDLILLKKTFPVIRLIEAAHTLSEARGLINEIREPTSDKALLLSQARDLLAHTGIFSEMSERILQRLDRARALLSTSFECTNLPVDLYFDSLCAKATSIANRLVAVRS
jgi:geranylgeranyl pyrophosphate synthase